MKQHSTHKYDVYISYNRQTDSRLATDLAHDLSRLGLRVFLDQWQLRAGELFSRAIEQALSESLCIVAIVSKSSIKSEWTEREWRSALTLEAPRLVPLLVDYVTPPASMRRMNSIRVKSLDSKSISQAANQIVRAVEQIRGGKTKVDRELDAIREQSKTLPSLGPRGFLPEGVHSTSLQEVTDRFGSGNSRRRLLGRNLSSISKRARKMGAEALILGGSFISTDPDPQDIDVLIVLPQQAKKITSEIDINVIQTYVASGQSTFIASDKESIERWTTLLENRFLSEPRGVVRIDLSGGAK